MCIVKCAIPIKLKLTWLKATFQCWQGKILALFLIFLVYRWLSELYCLCSHFMSKYQDCPLFHSLMKVLRSDSRSTQGCNLLFPTSIKEIAQKNPPQLEIPARCSLSNQSSCPVHGLTSNQHHQNKQCSSSDDSWRFSVSRVTYFRSINKQTYSLIYNLWCWLYSSLFEEENVHRSSHLACS